MEKTEEFLSGIAEKNRLHSKYLRKSFLNLAEEEKRSLEDLIAFFEFRGKGLPQQIEAYLMFVEDTMKEQFYFAQNLQYRHSTFDEVAGDVYYNDDYMGKYMLGLTLSHYLWTNHLEIQKWSTERLERHTGNQYLEVGPGFGEVFCKALEHGGFRKYQAIDLSKTSIEGTRAFIDWRFRGKEPPDCSLVSGDFFEYISDGSVDAFICEEVLEHLEDPLRFLKKVWTITSPDSYVYLSTVINAAAIDHIYLFQNKEQLFDLAKEAGFIVLDYICTTANSCTLEKAERDHIPITIAFQLAKQE